MKKKLLFPLLIGVLWLNSSNGQILITDPDNSPSNPINCTLFSNGAVPNFYDSGGAGSNYGDNENNVFTICPDLVNGGKISCSFAINVGFSWTVDGGDTLYVYDGPTTSAALIGAHNSVTSPIGFSHTASFNNPTGCLTFKFVSNGSVNTGGWAANITCGNPPQPFQPHIQAFLNGAGTNFLAPADTGYADMCFDDSILFEATGTFPYAPVSPATHPGYVQDTNNCTYLWKFSNGVQKTGRKVWFKPPNHAGYLVTLRMTDPINQIKVIKCKIRVSTIPSFATTKPVDDTICLGAQTTIVGGVTNTDTAGVKPITGAFEIGGSFAGLTYLPDGSGANYSTSVAIYDFLPGQTITNASDIQQMCVTMEHSYLGDLEMTLTCPNGTSTTIFNSYGSGGMIPGGFNGSGTFLGAANDNGNGTPGIGWQYCFADNALWGDFPTVFNAGNFTTVTNPPNPSDGNAMPSGTYKPEQNFSNFIGCPINGNWTITIQDNLGIDDGYIFEWGIFFNPTINPNTEFYTPVVASESWQADPTIISGQTDTAIVVKPTVAGPHSYTYSMTDNYGCNYDTTVTIYVLNPLTLPSSTAQTCDLFYQISGITSPGTVVWNVTSKPVGATVVFSADSTVVNPLVTVSGVGSYQLNLSDKTCNHSGTFAIEYLDDPHPVISDSTLCANYPLVIDVSGAGAGVTYLWNTGETASSISPVESGTYYVAVTNFCATTVDSADITFYPCDISVPNVITPNDGGPSGLNNHFYIQNLDFYPDSRLKIYNRWGTKVYESKDYQNNWSGDKHPNGVYYYVLEVKALKAIKYGFVQIIR